MYVIILLRAAGSYIRVRTKCSFFYNSLLLMMLRCLPVVAIVEARGFDSHMHEVVFEGILQGIFFKFVNFNAG